jgi:RHS repeat-associated protein
MSFNAESRRAAAAAVPLVGLTSVTAPSGRLIALAYDTAGRRTSVAYPNGLTTSAAFETPLAANGNTGRLTSIAHGLTSTGAPGSALNLKLGTFAYSYDVKGNIIAIAESGQTARTQKYTLDPVERLTAIKNAANANIESYSLDPEGNRIVSHLSSFHVTDAANRLQEDEKHQFEYDANGNMVRKTNKLTGVTWRYGYSVYDELTRASRHASADAISPALGSITYVFDALGRRVAERRFDAANAQTGGLNFHYDGEEVAHEAEVNAANVVTTGRWTTHSDGVDDLLAVTLHAGTGPSSPTAFLSGPAAPSNVSYYYQTDHQGSVRALTNQSGAVTNSYAYDSYGTALESVESLAQRFRYTGREYDALTELYHYRARAYDPDTARFLQEDPLGFDAGDLNVYRYVSSNPANWADPFGKNASQNYVAIAGATSAALLFGIVASKQDFVDGDATYRYLQKVGQNALSAVSGNINCTFFTLASIVELMTPGVSVAVDPSSCAALVVSFEGVVAAGASQGGDCPEHVAKAREICIGLYSDGKNRDRRKFGPNPMSISMCMLGYIPERCGGNPVDWGGKKNKR